MNAIVPASKSNTEAYRASTDAAAICRDMVVNTAMTISGRKYVKVEGWQAIAIAHGCAVSAEDVERVGDEGASGYRAQGVVRRMSDGAVIARAEGFLGDDEPMWTKRPVYARRAMVQTRAMSRACRSAFAHVVVMMNAGLSTTPAEEVPEGGFTDEPRNVTPEKPKSAHAARKEGKWPAMEAALNAAETMAELIHAAGEHREAYDSFPAGWKREADELYNKRREELEAAEAALDGAAERVAA